MIIVGENFGPVAKARRAEADGLASETINPATPISDRSGDRRRVLERGRRMLAVALVEDKRRIAAKGDASGYQPRPGCGAWWLF